MQVVVLMAGSGKRFADARYKDPKPLIKVHGHPMVEYVVKLFPGEEDFLFICRNGRLRETNLGEVLRALAPNGKVVGIDGHEDGPVVSLVEAAEYIKEGEPVIVSYCDFFMHWDYDDFKKTMLQKNPASSAVCYKGFHPHLLGSNLYAGVRATEDGEILEVREKHSFTPNKMDTWQQAGVFYFSSGGLLKKYSKKLIASSERVNNEYYVSMLYNPMIKDGLTCAIYPVEHFCQWGTPEDLAEYNKNSALAKNAGTYGEGIRVSPAIAYWREFFVKNQGFFGTNLKRHD